MRNERQLQEYLRDRLHLIEPGLSLLEPEFVLPNDRGSSGRVDLLARDQNGMHVLIELKGSRASSREAIQELGKYVHLLAESAALPRVRIRCIILSADWSELHAPFTELVATFPCNLVGYRFSIDNDGFPCSFERVEPRSFNPSVDLSPNHFIILTHSARERDQCLKNAGSLFSSVDLLDFLVFIFESHSPLAGEAEYILYFVLQYVAEHIAAVLARATQTSVEVDGSPTLFGNWENAAFYMIASGHGRDDVDPANPGTLLSYERRYPLWAIRKYGRFGRLPGVWTDRDLILETIRCAYGDPETDAPPSPKVLEVARAIHEWDV